MWHAAGGSGHTGTDWHHQTPPGHPVLCILTYRTRGVGYAGVRCASMYPDLQDKGVGYAGVRCANMYPDLQDKGIGYRVFARPFPKGTVPFRGSNVSFGSTSKPTYF